MTRGRGRGDRPSRTCMRTAIALAGVMGLTLTTFIAATAVSTPIAAVGISTEDPSPSASVSPTDTPTAPAVEQLAVGALTPDVVSVTAVVGSAIVPTAVLSAPTLTGTATFTIAPAPPAGLSIDATSGAISGTPVLAQSPTRYTVSATSDSGSAEATATVWISPVLAPPTFTVTAERRVRLAPTSGLFAIGFTGPVTFSADPALPAGLKLNVHTGSITGIPSKAGLPVTSTITATDGTFRATSLVSVSVSCGYAQGTAPACATVALKRAGTNANAPSMQPLGSTPDSIHGPFTTTTDSCAACHRTHSDRALSMAPQINPVSTLCFSCHDGTGASPNVYNEYYSGTNPSGSTLYTNDSSTRSIFTHDALSVANHEYPGVEPDGTAVISQEFDHTLNRHSECTDCHNPHSAATTDSTQTSAGWTAPGRIAAATGVSVDNGSAGTQPTYTLRGAAGDPITLEYQLCFKCHSGYTTLPSNTGFPSSEWYLDKGVELNPANGSTHPIEAAGSNDTAKMDDSLAGASPYKLWTFTSSSTIRCTNCHAGGTVTAAAGAGQDSPPHASPNRGILLAQYRDRVLHTRAEANYSDADFALCYQCHTNIPFTTETTTATNFAYHFKHMSAIGGKGSLTAGSAIDTPGDGAGNAICAECHYRLHSSQSMVGPQDLSGTRLVSFPPSVEPVDVGGVPTIKWNSTSTGHGTCTLLCHGKTHNALAY